MILHSIRKELEPLNQQIINHQILRGAEEGRLKRTVIEAFVVNQWYIVNHDLRSISIGLSRSSNMVELDLFKALLDGDYSALKELIKLMGELGIEVKDPVTFRVLPQAVSYTHYLAWLANYSRPVEFLFAMVINLPVWSYVVTKFGDSLKENYGIKETGFFDVFKVSYTEIENKVDELAEREEPDRLRAISYIIQDYERRFWDAIYQE
ncbi:TenA family transcriptional regulator [Stygiolobus caldivivus]|uniref:TenA family transcriptional regulator n=1 Tax=Stygiolobus caldivivus TaxID=2824673 RepID=A0A8D5ZIX6_9CREN|nr:TenA family transcriptional regulator [Stygiolobus caldivivus]BCU69662.1 TenA family transcriptional regulator [Stygiolobus caldivivus]